MQHKEMHCIVKRILAIIQFTLWLSAINKKWHTYTYLHIGTYEWVHFDTIQMSWFISQIATVN